MLLCTRLSDDTDLYIDCETAGGFDKDTVSLDFHPDDAAANVVKVARGVVSQLREVALAAGVGAELEVEFSVKVDSAAVVSVARSTEAGQFKVRVHYR